MTGLAVNEAVGGGQEMIELTKKSKDSEQT
jgi:hypothetical protein